MLEATNGTLNDKEKEQFDYEKAKQSLLVGIFHALILKGYEENSFEEKFKNYLYNSSIEETDV